MTYPNIAAIYDANRLSLPALSSLVFCIAYRDTGHVQLPAGFSLVQVSVLRRAPPRRKPPSTQHPTTRKLSQSFWASALALEVAAVRDFVDLAGEGERHLVILVVDRRAGIPETGRSDPLAQATVGELSEADKVPSILTETAVLKSVDPSPTKSQSDVLFRQFQAWAAAQTENRSGHASEGCAERTDTVRGKASGAYRASEKASDRGAQCAVRTADTKPAKTISVGAKCASASPSITARRSSAAISIRSRIRSKS